GPGPAGPRRPDCGTMPASWCFGAVVGGPGFQQISAAPRPKPALVARRGRSTASAAGRWISQAGGGRVGILELTPFLFCEIAGRRGVRLDTLWQRGGYPDAFLARGSEAWQAWHENYLRTFIERDIARHRLTLSSV